VRRISAAFVLEDRVRVLAGNHQYGSPIEGDTGERAYSQAAELRVVQCAQAGPDVDVTGSRSTVGVAQEGLIQNDLDHLAGVLRIEGVAGRVPLDQGLPRDLQGVVALIVAEVDEIAGVHFCSCPLPARPMGGQGIYWPVTAPSLMRHGAVVVGKCREARAP
jgi:hypothetical protein